MTFPTEPIGSIPRPLELIQALARKDAEDSSLEPLYEEAVRDTVKQFEAARSPVITDGEQRKYHSSGRIRYTRWRTRIRMASGSPSPPVTPDGCRG